MHPFLFFKESSFDIFSAQFPGLIWSTSYLWDGSGQGADSGLINSAYCKLHKINAYYCNQNMLIVVYLLQPMHRDYFVIHNNEFSLLQVVTQNKLRLLQQRQNYYNHNFCTLNTQLLRPAKYSCIEQKICLSHICGKQGSCGDSQTDRDTLILLQRK